jgi:hypothetical protein
MRERKCRARLVRSILSSGRVELQTEEGLMQFSLAPEDTEQFKVGEKVEVELGPEITPEEGAES